AGIMFSTRFHQDAAAALAYIFTLGGFFLLPRVPHLVLHAQGLQRDMMLLIYYALPHFELFDLRIRLAYDWGAIAWSMLLAVALYGALMILFMLLVGWCAYRGKQFSRMERL
ncbi:MAG: hypothetical protein LC725_10230, partial [Lentisphaerae bacterium]|nr:hypothetical protein [Lentisphaerota bacterium]